MQVIFQRLCDFQIPADTLHCDVHANAGKCSTRKLIGCLPDDLKGGQQEHFFSGEPQYEQSYRFHMFMLLFL